MPLINIEYDTEHVSDREIQALSEEIQKIVSTATEIEDVFVYANSARIKVEVAPIEIFVQMTATKIKDQDALISEIRSKLKEWKVATNFSHLINLTLIPMNWKIEIGI